MAVPPTRDPWYRRYWGAYNRPFPGCGCIVSLVILAAIWFVLSLIFPELAIWASISGIF